MSYTPNALPILWNTLATKYVDYTETSVGDYVHYDGSLYKFTKATKVYSTSSAYAVDDYCIHDDSSTTTPDYNYYKCISEITSGESWTAAHWSVVTETVWIAATASTVTVSSQFGSGASVDYAPVAKAFSTESAYEIGDSVIYDGKLYKAKAAMAKGAWDASKWTQSYAAECAANTNSNIGNKLSATTPIAKGDLFVYNDTTYSANAAVPVYDASYGTYAIGDYVEQDGKFYICNTAITTPEAFDSAKWDEKNAAEMVAAIGAAATVSDNFVKISTLGSTLDYSTSATYKLGEHVIYDDVVYTAKVNIDAAEPWTPAHWTATNLLDLINGRFKTNAFSSGSLMNISGYASFDTNYIKKYDDMPYYAKKAVHAYNAHRAYAVGDFIKGNPSVSTDKNFYKCTTAISLPGEAFDASKWTVITPENIISSGIFGAGTLAGLYGKRFLSTSIADTFTWTSDCTPGKVYTYEGQDKLYRCKKAVSTYSTSTTYNIGDWVKNTSTRYAKCVVDGTTGTWDATKWDVMVATAEYHYLLLDTNYFEEVQVCDLIPTNSADSIYPAYDSSSTYAIADKCFYNGDYYMCISAITTAEAWTAAHWQKVNRSEQDELDIKALALALGATRSITWDGTQFVYNYTVTP